MNNCLVTKLKAEVQNDELPYLGMMKIKATATKDSAGFLVASPWSDKLDIKSKTPFSLYKYGNSVGDVIATNVTSYTWANKTARYENAFISVPNDDVEHIYYVSKYNISRITNHSATSTDLGVRLLFDVEEILYSDKLIHVWSYMEGTIKELPTTSLKRLTIGNAGTTRTTAVGDITSTVNKNKIEYLAINNTVIALDLNQLNGDCGKSISELYVHSNKNVKGELYNWLQKIHDAGRVSGKINMILGNTKATVNGQTPKLTSYTVTFTSDGFTVN